MTELPERPLALAPMVDLSHVALRELVRSFPGADLLYSEMLNSRMVPREKPQQSTYLRWARTDDLVFQVVGNDPERIAETVTRLDGFNPAGIDINMGCWLKKVTCHGWGVALMQDPELARTIITRIRACTTHPLSVKIRIGYEPDPVHLKEFGSMIQESGADRIVLHARTVADGLNRPPRWEYIALLKEHLSIPVMGNGGINSAADAVRMLTETGCDGVMVGRAAVKQPWIFRDIRDLLAGREPQPAPELEPVCLMFIDLLERHFDPVTAMKRFRVALPWLAANLTFAHHFVRQVKRAATTDEARALVRQTFADGIS